jgi:hypothetical protein
MFMLAIALAVIFVGTASPSVAQERPQLKRPQQTPDEKPVETKKAKKVKGPRAVGILQLSDGKAILVPVAILVEGKFHDASVYKAEPLPMALESGTVYEAEQAGESQGLFTTNGAMHSKAVNSANPWWGTGSYYPNGTEAAKTRHKAEDVPVGMDSSGDEPPRLTRKKAASESSPVSPSPGTSGTPPSSGTPASSEKPDASGPSGGDTKKEPNTTSDKGAQQSGEKKSPSAETGTGQSSAAQPGSGQAPSGQSPQAKETENYYRPTLRRGKPTQPAPEEKDITPQPIVAGPAAASIPVAGAKPVQLMAAISDSGGPDPQSYKFFWKEGEEDERRKQMLTLAGDELRAYVTARTKGAIVATTAPATKPATQRRKAAVKPSQPVFENIRFATFDVWKTNQPVMILSAEAHFPAEAGATSAPETYSITLVSRTDIYGSLRKLYSGVTDRFHLDVTPRLDLIDAVDADGDGRGELLFRETTDGGGGYIIYRATGDKLWKMFDSLSAE